MLWPGDVCVLKQATRPGDTECEIVIVRRLYEERKTYVDCETMRHPFLTYKQTELTKIGEL